MRGRIPVRIILATIGLVIATAGALALLYAVRGLIFNVVVAIFLALVLTPGVEYLRQRHILRGWAIAIVFAGVLVAASGIAASIAAPLATQGANVARHAPVYLKQAEEGRGPVGRLAHRFHLERDLKRHRARGLERSVEVVVVSARRRTRHRVRSGTDGHRARPDGLHPRRRTAHGRGGDDRDPTGPARLRPADRTLVSTAVSSYTIGVLLLATLNGVITAIALETMRVPFVLPLAMWACVVDILPIVGGLLAMTVAALFAFTKSIPAGIGVVVMLV